MKKILAELKVQILKKALSNGGDYADIFTEHTNPVSIQLEDDKVEKLVSGVDAGVGIRVIYEGRSAYAFSNEFSKDSLFQAAKAVSRVVKEGKGQRELVIDLTRKKPLIDFPVRRHPRAVGIKEKVNIMEEANAAAKGVSPLIRQVLVSYRDNIQNLSIAASDDSLAEDERIHTVALIQVVAAEGDVLQTGYEPIGGLKGFELFKENPLPELAVKAANKAVAMLKARKAPGGRMPVVISAEAGGTMIHEAVGHGLEADLVQQGLSVYTNRVGERIASTKVTIVDDATLLNKRGSFRFDDEGIHSKRTVLVDKGLLKGYMHSRLSAMKDDVEPTGNGRRQSYKYRPIPRMTNTYIESGSEKTDDIVKSVAKGFFVKKMGGGQVNTVTGEFVFEVSEGYLIENGMVSEPVRGATLIGNGPDILRSIDMVGDDLGSAIGTCGKDGQSAPVSDAMPTVRIPEMVIGGMV